jgi:hypothetical protein
MLSPIHLKKIPETDMNIVKPSCAHFDLARIRIDSMDASAVPGYDFDI